MTEYITKEQAYELLGDGNIWGRKALIETKPADVAPVVHARWIINKDRTAVCCSNCNHKKYDCADEIKLLDTAFCGLNFCEYCGARMDGE